MHRPKHISDNQQDARGPPSAVSAGQLIQKSPTLFESNSAQGPMLPFCPRKADT